MGIPFSEGNLPIGPIERQVKGCVQNAYLIITYVLLDEFHVKVEAFAQVTKRL